MCDTRRMELRHVFLPIEIGSMSVREKSCGKNNAIDGD